MTETKEGLAKKARSYNFLLYFAVILQSAALTLFLYTMTHDEMTMADIAGRIPVMANMKESCLPIAGTVIMLSVVNVA